MGARESSTRIINDQDQMEDEDTKIVTEIPKPKSTESAGIMYESDFESEIEIETKDGVLKNTKEAFLFHPEGSFLAFLHDKSEENVASLIKNSASRIMENNIETELTQLHHLLPEIREHIWQYLSYADRTQVRLTCRKFRDEIDNTVGIQLYLTDADEDSLRLALTTSAIQRLIISHVEMSTLGTLLPTNPSRLLDFKVLGPVSPDVLHEIFRRCPNIQALEICHQPQGHSLLNSSDNPSWGSLDNWHLGKLFLEWPEIKQYGFLKKLRHLRFISKKAEPEVMENLVTYSLLPLLRSLQSFHVRSIDIEICLWEEASKKIMQVLFEIILRCRSLQQFRFHELRTDLNASQPIGQVDREDGRKNTIALLGFGEFNPCPQFESIDIEIPFCFSSYFDWINLLESQRKLKHLVWDVGGNYFGYPVEAIKQSGKTLESLTLRMLRCYRNEKMEGTEDKPEFFSVEAIYEFIALKQLQIVGMEFSTCRFSRLDLLPRTLLCLQIECFQILPDQLMTIHRTLPNLRLFSLSYWNDSRLNFMQSLSTILDMISSGNDTNDKKYRGLSFIEKSMYTSIEELAEINGVMGRIRQVSFANKLSVDQVSGDNGMGFILVIGEQDDCFEDVIM